MMQNGEDGKDSAEAKTDMFEGTRRYRDKRRVPVIVADDSATTRKQIVKSLRNTDARVVPFEAGDGREALDKLAELREEYNAEPALIILDLNMPNMDGWQVTKTLKREYEKAGKPMGIPLVVFSSTSGAKGTLPFKKDIHKIGYTPFVAVAKEECVKMERYDAKGSSGLEAWVRYFVEGSGELW